MCNKGLLEVDGEWNEIINTFKLTDKGYAFLREMLPLRRLFKWLLSNLLLTVIVTVGAGLLLAYLSGLLGLSK